MSFRVLLVACAVTCSQCSASHVFACEVVAGLAAAPRLGFLLLFNFAAAALLDFLALVGTAFAALVTALVFFIGTPRRLWAAPASLLSPGEREIAAAAAVVRVVLSRSLARIMAICSRCRVVETSARKPPPRAHSVYTSVESGCYGIRGMPPGIAVRPATRRANPE